MKLLYLTFGPFGPSSSHLARLYHAMPLLSESNDVTILNLAGKRDTVAEMPRVDFLSLKAEMTGWNINNIRSLCKEIIKIAKKKHIDLIVLQMEAWDIMRELPKLLPGNITMATVVHAMPFLGSPPNPTTDFDNDVMLYAHSLCTDFKKSYILDHYKEMTAVINSHAIITSSDSVRGYFYNYFSGLPTHHQHGHVRRVKDGIRRVIRNKDTLKLAYMARIEEGKGLAYLGRILEELRRRLSKRIDLTILGRTDDQHSKKMLDSLVGGFNKNTHVLLRYGGWADQELKDKILGSSDVFIYPSSHDNNPVVVHEALSYGLPCVLWDLPFSRASFGGCGAVRKAKFMDVNNFVEAIIAADINFDKLQSDARQFEATGLSSAELSEQYIKLYEVIIKKSNE